MSLHLTTRVATLCARHPARRFFASAGATLPLAYDLHLPPKDAPRDGRPIVFMHGFFGSKKNNRGISKRLASDLGRPIYAVDLRNHGDSPHDPTHHYLAMAADVLAFMKEHNLAAPTLIGHSMGAKTAMTVALQSPEHVSDLIAVDNAPVDAALRTAFAQYVIGMKEIEGAGVTRLSEADAILAKFEESLPIRQFLLQNLHQPPGSKTRQFRVPLATLTKALDHMGDFPYKNPGEVRFVKPTLFVRGTKSAYVPDEVIPLIGQFFPRFRLVDVEAGHWLISENPEEFRRAVVDFLQPPDDS